MSLQDTSLSARGISTARFWMVFRGALWMVIYLALTLTPVLLMFFGPRPAGREFWRELSVALGFAGLGMMALQFVLTARFQWLKAPYGSDIIYHFHRQISLVAFSLILAHPILLFVFSPDTLGLLNLFTAPWRARAAVVGLGGLIALVLLSIFRRRWKIDYTAWRIGHGILAAVAISLSMVHVILVGHYINTPWKQAFWVVYGAFWVGLLLYTRLIRPLILLRRPYRVLEVRAERGLSWTVVLEPVGHAGFRFQPGQFAWITAWNSPFADTEHPFSISSGANPGDPLAFTIKEFGDFTRRIKDLRPGQTVYVDGPYGSFSVDHHAHAGEFVMIAGGVGITPMMSMLRTLAARRDRRPLTLFYANKSWDQVIFREEIEALRERLNLKVVHVLEAPPDGWTGETGFLNRSILERHWPAQKERNQVEAFICGPDPMMYAVEKHLDAMGVWAGDYHSERFALV